MFKSAKGILLLCLLCSLLLAVFFHNAIFSGMATSIFRAYATSQWGKSFHYDAVLYEGNRIVVLKPRYKKSSKFSAEQLIVTFGIDWRKFQLATAVSIDQPHVHLNPSRSSRLPEWEKLIVKDGKWIKIHPTFHVEKGLLTWQAPNGTPQSLQFDLQGNSREGGFVTLYFDKDNHDNNLMTLQAVSKAGEMDLICHCRDVCCSSMMALAKLIGIDLTPWTVVGGFLQGDLKAFFPKAERPHLEGSLLVDQLDFIQTETNIKGHVEEACLKIEKNPMAYDGSQQVPTIICEFDILKPASLTYSSHQQEWIFDHVLGTVKLNDIETVSVDLSAQGGDSNYPSQWNLKGTANLNSHRSLNLDLTLLCASADRPDSKVHLFIHQIRDGLNRAEIQLTQLGSRNFTFLQTVLDHFLPVFNEFELEEGIIDAIVEADILPQGIDEIDIKNFHARNLQMKLHPWNAQFSFDEASGNGKVNLAEDDFWNSLNLDLHVDNGEFEFKDVKPSLPLKAIQANVAIRQGHVEHSLVTLQLAGLKGVLDIEWGNTKRLLTLKLDGIAQDLVELLPVVVQDGVREQFNNDRLTVLANVVSKRQQFEIGGSVHIQRGDAEPADLIHFGCELKRAGDDRAATLTPFGWFYAHQLPVEKYLSPFLFQNGKLKMSGIGEFKGSFDDRLLTIKYDAENFKIENDELCIEAKKLRSVVPGQLLGSHEVDLKTYSHQGTLPFSQSSYLAKSTGLFFQDMQGTISFEDEKIHISPLEGYCEGIYFSGALDFDYGDPNQGVFNLSLHCNTLLGKVSQVKSLMAHLNHSSLLSTIPLEGEISTKGEGLKANFAFLPHDYRLEAEFHGNIAEGSLPFDGADMALKGIYMDVDYHNDKRLLEFSDIQGTLLVGKPRRVEEYPISGSHIRVQNLLDPNIDFDISVRDKDKELFRFACHSKDEGKKLKSFHFDPQLSHFSGIQPQLCHCFLNDWSTIDRFEFKSSFDLGLLLQDLQRFKQTGLFFFSPDLIAKLSQYTPLEGKASFDLYYHPADRLFTYQLEGGQIKLQGDLKEHSGLIQGRKQDKKWIFDHLQWDDWNIYAELLQSENQWKIPFLGLKSGSTLLLGLEGELDAAQSLVKGKLNLCEVDLAGIERWEVFKPFAAKWLPKGRLKVSGDFEWNLDSPDLLNGFTGKLQAETTNFTIRNYPIRILSPFQMSILSDQNLSFGDVHIELLADSIASMNVQQLDYQSKTKRLKCSELAFQIPSKQLHPVGESLHHHFPDMLDGMIKDLLVSSKPQGELRGKLMFDHSEQHHSLRLKLDNGQYCFKNRNFDLEDIELQIAGDQVLFSASSTEERSPYQALVEASLPSCQEGICTLIETSPHPRSSAYQPLRLHWENHPEEGLFIRSAQGEFSGCTFDLLSNESQNRKVMEGVVALDFNRLSSLLPVDVAEKIQKLKVDSLFTLNGRFWMDHDLGKGLMGSSYFEGKFGSVSPVLKGYQFERLAADMQYAPGRLDMENFVLEDAAGNASVSNLSVMIEPETDRWMFFIPQLMVKNFRPYFLRDVEDSSAQGSSKFRSLVVKQIEVQDFSGELDNIQTWQGGGVMHFINPSRKNLTHPLFAIPAEIILRLGLDPQVLNPVTGTILFTLKGDKIYFDRFKDVYSEGRGSKFYLADGTNPSWMDYDGNLSIQIRMKQYNLMFKIAELFTVSVQGNLKKPTYTLQKQTKNSIKEQVQSFVYSE